MAETTDATVTDEGRDEEELRQLAEHGDESTPTNLVLNMGPKAFIPVEAVSMAMCALAGLCIGVLLTRR